MRLYIFDLDGTIANIDRRLPLVKGKKKYFDKFYAECIYDSPNDWVINLAKTIRAEKFNEHRILILSGRSDVVKKDTLSWLVKHNVPFDFLVMRKAGDHTPDDDLKEQMLKAFLAEHKEVFAFQVEFIVDDRQRVVDMWRRNGYNVLQCNAWEETK